MHQQVPPPDRRLTRALALARAALAWEALWPLLLPPVAVASLFVSLALLDVPRSLPGWLHAVGLAGFAGLFSYLAWRVPSRFRPPSAAEAARRLERDSGLAHRPLAALSDRPAGDAGDPVSAALWQAHLARMEATLAQPRIAWPEPGMAARDPYGWRAAALLLLVIAFAVGGHDWPARFERAAIPDLGLPGTSPDSLEVWVTPPAYTGAPPVLLRPDIMPETPVAVPAGSTVLSVLTGGWGAARLVIDGVETPFQRQGEAGQRVETHLEAGTSIAITQGGRQVAEWPIRVVTDAAPSAEFARPPEPGARGRLRFSVEASDDYGLAGAGIEMRRIDDPGDGEAVAVPLPLAGSRPRQAGISSWQDLTAHPWAGLPVSLAAVARDALGQEGRSEPITLVLPERTFTHPIARALIEQRRLVTDDPRANAPGAAAIIERITSDPDLIGGDLKVFLALRTARGALLRADGPDLAEVQDLLWNAALRLEEGDLSEAERAFEAARRALEQAIEDGAPAGEIQQLLDEFQAALARYLEALGNSMAEQGAQPGAAAADRVMTEQDLADMLDSMRAMAESGSTEALRRMLQDMSSALSNLQAEPMPAPSAETMRALGDLDALTRRQQQLLDRTFRQAQQGQGQSGQGESGQGESGGQAGGGQGGGGSSSGDPAGAARSQRALQNLLDDVMKRLDQGMGGLPGGLPEAGQAMEDAAGALAEGRWGDAAEAQGEAVERLRSAGAEAAQKMGAAGTGSSGLVPRDPLGRPMTGSGHGDDGTTAIPTVSDIQRAREILDELRRRAGEMARPEPERDYLKRLLKQF